MGHGLRDGNGPVRRYCVRIDSELGPRHRRLRAVLACLTLGLAACTSGPSALPTREAVTFRHEWIPEDWRREVSPLLPLGVLGTQGRDAIAVARANTVRLAYHATVERRITVQEGAEVSPAAVTPPELCVALSGGGIRARRRDPKLPTRELTAEALARVVALCARQRTVGIRQRLDNLIPLARRVLPGAVPVTGTSSPGDLTFSDAKGQSSFIRVVPFRPRAETIWQACGDGAKHGVSGCFYAENDPNDMRARALRWLANGKRPTDPARSDGWVWACFGDTVL